MSENSCYILKVSNVFITCQKSTRFLEGYNLNKGTSPQRGSHSEKNLHSLQMNFILTLPLIEALAGSLGLVPILSKLLHAFKIIDVNMESEKF